MVEGVGHLAPLELGVQRKDRKPVLRQIPEVTDPSPRIGHQQPAATSVAGQDLGDTVRPTGEKLSRQARLERLQSATRFEPRDTISQRNS
jgi:hypothetical protein